MPMLFNKVCGLLIMGVGDNFGLNDNYTYHEIELDSLDTGTAYNSGYATTDWPIFTVGGKGPIQDVVALKVLEVQIPFSFYVFTSTNNTFLLTDSGGTVTVTIPIGNYNVGTTSMPLALSTALTAASLGGNAYAVAYNPLLNVFDFTSSTNDPFTFTFGAGYGIYGVQPNSGNKNPRLYIGFPPGDTNSFSITGPFQRITSPNSLLVTGPNYLYLNSSMLGSDIPLYLPLGAFNLGGGKAGPQIAKIPITCNPYETIFWADPDPQKWFKYETLQTLNACDFYLTLGNTTTQVPLQLNGLSFSIKLGLLVEEAVVSDRVLSTAQSGRVTSRQGPKRVRPAY